MNDEAVTFCSLAVDGPSSQETVFGSPWTSIYLKVLVKASVLLHQQRSVEPLGDPKGPTAMPFLPK
jgi:hypothetical protein